MPETISGSCHCGAVTFTISRPDFMVACNCSICRRVAALWVHAPPATAQVQAAPNATKGYVQGDKTLAIQTCTTCGCTTHWTGLDGERMAVNLLMADPQDIKDIRTRHFDGAESWAFLD